MQLSSTIEIFDTVVNWEYNSSYYWNPFSSTEEVKLEKAYQRNPKGSVDIELLGVRFTVHFSTMTMDNSLRQTRQVKRIEKQINKRKINVKELNVMFLKYITMDEPDEEAESFYRDNDVEGIGGNGILQFCEDHKIDPSSIDLLYLFYKLKSHRKYYLNYNEFVRGLAALEMETSNKIKKEFPKLKKALGSQEELRNFYRWTYTYLLDPNQKTVNKDLALATWPLFISKYPYFDDWMTFMREVYPHSPSRDLWNQFFDFMHDISFKSFSEYDFASSAYNSAIDDFVTYMLNK